MPNASPFWSVRDRLKLRKLRGGPKLSFLGYGFLFESLHPNAEGRYCSNSQKTGILHSTMEKFQQVPVGTSE
jgi:hypothetical protein